MYSNGNPRIVEGTDIEQVQSLGDAVTLPDGRTALPVLLVLAAHSGKSYGPGQLPDSLHYTDGVLPRLLPLLPEGALTHVATVGAEETLSAPNPPFAQGDSGPVPEGKSLGGFLPPQGDETPLPETAETGGDSFRPDAAAADDEPTH